MPVQVQSTSTHRLQLSGIKMAVDISRYSSSQTTNSSASADVCAARTNHLTTMLLHTSSCNSQNLDLKRISIACAQSMPVEIF
jgi:hypothetical protein